MTLGCGYPQGPFQLLDAAGPAAVLAGLESMQAAYGDSSLAAPTLLAEHAVTGIAFGVSGQPAGAGSTSAGAAGARSAR